ncbi:hypothetical protein CKA38_08305 [Ereboglobus luteus]|uniref:TonB-dependent receptor-like beta-barrel domain-containing protein n=1 Tax=Ereboglobus luteus TaxID=1796921 RepID=A0A2U8E356_9BACT|nr:hypothetical protein CKA38_08305 [Ereboglobus luteus]
MSRNDTLSFTVQTRQVTSDRATSRLTTRFHYNMQYDPVGDAGSTSTKEAGGPLPGSTTGATEPGGGTIEMGGNAALNYSEVTDSTHMTLRYRHRSSKWQIDAQAVYSSAERVRSSMNEGYFNGYYALGNQSTTRGYDMKGYDINVGDSILPNSYVIKNSDTGETVDRYDGDTYYLQSVREEDGKYKTDMYSGRVDVTRVFNHRFSLKAGGAFSRLKKDDWRLPINYTFVGDEQYGADTAAGRIERKMVRHYDILDESIDVDSNGNAVRWISPVKLYQLFLSNPEYFQQNTSTIQYKAEYSKKMIEDISSAYLRFDLNLFSNRMHIIGGVRYERTDLEGWSVKIDHTAKYHRDPETGQPLRNPDDSLQLITTDTVEQTRLIYKARAFYEGQNYDGFYPSLNINYAFTDNLVLRAAYARTIGRPDVRYVVDGIRVPELTAKEVPDPGSEEDDDETNTAARVIRVGNPGLKPWTADSFHLSLDSYHLKGGFGSIGVYRKNVTNFFADRAFTANRQDLEYYGISDADIDFMIENDYAIRRWVNVGDAHLTGLEISYRQDLFFLPSWLQKIQVWANYTHLKVGGPNAEEFTGFTPDALSCGINYIRPRFSIRLTCAYQAETKSKEVPVAEGTQAARFTPQDTYEYQASSIRYGITAEYSLSRAFTLYMNWNNIFGKDTYVYRRAADTPAYAQNYQRYIVPSYIMIGVKGRF